jgi:KipI family sensor histidine kinase inhibitor
MKILPFGDRALLAEFSSLEQTIAAFRAFDAARAPGIIELIPAASTVLARVDPTTLSLRAAEQWLTSTYLRASNNSNVAEAAAPSITIPVRYDGPDLASSALVLGISPDELVSRHSQAHWLCSFIGFVPGFAYLASTDSNFDLPRRETSRASVPAGSVGLAGEFTGIYPRSSPGGWQIIGTTAVRLWDESRDAPAAITPGMTVRFEVETL